MVLAAGATTGHGAPLAGNADAGRQLLTSSNCNIANEPAGEASRRRLRAPPGAERDSEPGAAADSGDRLAAAAERRRRPLRRRRACERHRGGPSSLAPKPPGCPSTALAIQITPYSARSRHGATQPETRLNPSRWVPQGHADHPSQLGPRGTHPGPPAPPNAALAARRAAPAGLVRVLGAALRSQHWGARRVSRGAGSCAAVERRAYV